jgi:hypothetical protein
MMRLARTFRTSNSQICNICKNNYLPGQIILDKNENVIRCVECEWEATYMTKIYPGEKPAYTPHPPRNEGPYPRNEWPLMERPPRSPAVGREPPKQRNPPVEKLR